MGKPTGPRCCHRRMISLQAHVPAAFNNGTQNNKARVAWWCPVCDTFRKDIKEQHQHIKW